MEFRPIKTIAFLLGVLFFRCALADYSSGTGFFITTDGHIVTNYHVIDNAHEILVYDFNLNKYQAEVILADKSNDLAIIKINGGNHSALPIRQSNEVSKGDTVFTVGYPNIDLQGLESKVTQGIISSRRLPGFSSIRL